MENAESLIKARIREQGPMDIGQFMGLALGHPRHGYYMTRDPLGARGDFTTSPEISQMFGEMFAVCLMDAWLRAGSLDIHLVELGPGRGTLMADILRACATAPDFYARMQLHLVETSPVLREAQKKAIAEKFKPRWHVSIATLPEDAPLLVVANEFFDALPVRQAVAGPRGWLERVITLEGDTLAYGTRPLAFPLPVMAEGSIVEFSPEREAVMETLAVRLQKQGGMLLTADYGHAQRNAVGDTFQAVRKHGFCSPLENVGDADLTSHVDFARLADICVQAGCSVHGPVPQKDFLERMGIYVRLEAFEKLGPHTAHLRTGVERLTAAGGMGTLFKVMAVSGNARTSRFQPSGFV